jgi:DMSO/TMAO reductase YedYZ heme-binding membrane subunit
MSERDDPPYLWQAVTAKWLAAIGGFSLVYAVVRYHVAGDVPWENFPLFILNKTLSLAAVLLIASSYLVGRVFKWHDHDPAIRLIVVKFCGLMGFFLAGIHALMSLALLSPAYYAKYFDAATGRLNFVGELGMAVGVLAMFALLAPAITTLPMMPKAIGGKRWKRNQRFGYVALALVAIHLIDLGLGGWLKPGTWQWGIPPISLVAVVAALLPVVVKLATRKRA